MTAPVDDEGWLGRIARWLGAGNTAYDRSGRLRQAERKVRTGEWLRAMVNRTTDRRAALSQRARSPRV